MRRRVMVFIILILTGSALRFGSTHELLWSSAASAQSAGTDWPQLQNDPQKTGYSTQTIKTDGSLRVKWSWHPDDPWTPLADQAQPVVAGSVVVIADLGGTVHGLNVATGAKLWEFTAKGPFYASAAIMGSTVYIGSQDGNLYALNLATGAKSWQIDTGAGIVTAPLIFSNTIIVANKAGRVIAANQAGSIMWSKELPAPILMSPAAASNGTIFVGAENMVAYALNSNASGAILWEKQLFGDSFRYSWPVVAEAANVVFFRTEPAKPFHVMLNNPSTVLENNRCQNFTYGECHPNNTNTNCSALTCTGLSAVQVTANDFVAEQARIKTYLTQNPQEQTFYALDTATGNTKYIAPILYTGGGGSWPTPPVIDTAKNVAYVIYRSYYSNYDSGTTVRPYVDIAKMDLATGAVTPFPCAKLGGESCKNNWEDFHLVGDEETHLSAVANSVLVGSWLSLGGLEINNPRTFYIVGANASTRSSPTLTNAQWQAGTFAHSWGNPIAAFAGGRVLYRSGLLGMLE